MGLTAGMQGLAAPIALTISAPPGVSFLDSPPSIVFEFVATKNRRVRVENAAVIWSGITSTQATATYTPNGTELPDGLGEVTFAVRVTAGAWVIDYRSQIATVQSNVRVE